MRCTSVVIADRHPVVLQGLTKLLGAQSGFNVVACCSDGTNCIEAIRSLVPDIAILDISMPGLTGLEILAIANSEDLSTRLVFFTASVVDPDLVSEGLSNKAIGRRLNIAGGTIKVHLHHIYQKLEINNRTVLAALALSHNDRG